jgi:hypothetical protein
MEPDYGVSAVMLSSTVVELPLRSLPVETNDVAQQCLALWHGMGLFDRPKVGWLPGLPLPYQKFLEIIFDTSHHHVDAIVFADPSRTSVLHDLRAAPGSMLVPIIDLTGRATDFADVRFDIADRDSWAQTARRILDFRERRRQLGPAFATPAAPEMELLAHSFVSGRTLAAQYSASIPETVCYPGYPPARVTIPLAEGLVRRGLLKKTFFDRLHECGACGSRRLLVREECPACRSANLHEVALVHHYSCAALEAEDNFRQGSALVCPKCRKQLRNYGKDYDKPGVTQVCRQCTAASSEPEIGFVCLDCNARADGQSIRCTDLFSYDLTDNAIALLTSHVKPLGLRDLPTSLTAAVDRLRHNSSHLPLAILEVRYEAQDVLCETRGALVFEKLRTLFIENLANNLGDHEVSLHIGNDCEYLLVNGYEASTFGRTQRLLQQCEDVLSDRLRPIVRVLARSRRGKS